MRSRSREFFLCAVVAVLLGDLPADGSSTTTVSGTLSGSDVSNLLVVMIEGVRPGGTGEGAPKWSVVGETISSTSGSYEVVGNPSGTEVVVAVGYGAPVYYSTATLSLQEGISSYVQNLSVPPLSVDGEPSLQIKVVKDGQEIDYRKIAYFVSVFGPVDEVAGRLIILGRPAYPFFENSAFGLPPGGYLVRCSLDVDGVATGVHENVVLGGEKVVTTCEF